jgi:hypothetical protein
MARFPFWLSWAVPLKGARIAGVGVDRALRLVVSCNPPYITGPHPGASHKIRTAFQTKQLDGVIGHRPIAIQLLALALPRTVS